MVAFQTLSFIIVI